MTNPEVLPEAFRKTFACQLSTGQSHDFVIHCKDGHEFKVHRNILAAQSDFFKAAVGSNFAEGVSQTMNLFDDDSALIARMLAFMYTGEYCVENLTTNPTGLQLDQFHGLRDSFAGSDMNWCDKSLLHCHLFALADKYAIPNLRTEAFSRFGRSYFDKDEVEEQLTHGPGQERKGKDNGDGGSDGEIFTELELEQISSVIRAIYESARANVRELRRVVVRGIYLCVDGHMFDNKAMRAAPTEVPDFASDLAIAYHASLTTHDSTCGACGASWVEPVKHLSACEIVGLCNAAGCQQKWVRESVCLDCFTVGKMTYPSPLERDDGTPKGQRA